MGTSRKFAFNDCFTERLIGLIAALRACRTAMEMQRAD